MHDPEYVDYSRRACKLLPPGKSIYPIIFPIRNIKRPPKDFELQVGYYCMDTFTPLNNNAYIAARNAVDCAVTGAHAVLDDYHFAMHCGARQGIMLSAGLWADFVISTGRRCSGVFKPLRAHRNPRCGFPSW